MNAKELVTRVQSLANSIMGKYAKGARLGGTHKYGMGNAQSRRLAAVILRSRRSARRSTRQSQSRKE
jgi:hypothetical protein